MPRSLLLSLVAAVTLAACSKQEAETGAAPAPETAAPEANAPAPDAVPADTAMVNDAADTVEEAMPDTTAVIEDTVPAEAAPAVEETMDSTLAPTDAAPADSAGY